MSFQSTICICINNFCWPINRHRKCTFLINQTNKKFLSVVGFSAGVMIYVSFVEICRSKVALTAKIRYKNGNWAGQVQIFLGAQS